jgi:AcrR family transcriptional regulator
MYRRGVVTASEQTPGASGPAFEDLTARARIRQAALDQFAEHGYERTTIRGIATAAGVSPGLVRHHFGSKQALRDAVDEYVLQEIRRVNEQVIADSDSGDLSTSSALSVKAMQPFSGYVSRGLTEGSTIIAKMFDRMVDLTEQWIIRADANRTDPPMQDTRTRAAVINAMAMGVPLMREHLSRVLGVDTFSPEGNRQVALALLDIYSHALVTPDLAATATTWLEAPPGKHNQ